MTKPTFTPTIRDASETEIIGTEPADTAQKPPVKAAARKEE